MFVYKQNLGCETAGTGTITTTWYKLHSKTD